MKTLLLLALAFSPITAFADGFKCETANDTLNVKIFNSVDPSIGTRVPAVVIVSDSRRQFGNKTIATFSGEKGLIAADGATYDVNVDGRFSGVERGGEDIAGTKLKFVKTLKISIAYSYDRPLQDGARVSGSMIVVKTDGSRIYRALDCNRYLKLK